MSKLLLLASALVLVLSISIGLNQDAHATANLFVSAENSKWNNYFAGPQVIQVIVSDPAISQLNANLTEPFVTINGKTLRMAQATDGNWYGYFADSKQAQIASATQLKSGNPTGKGLDFGAFCSPTSASTTIATGVDFSQTNGIAISRSAPGAAFGSASPSATIFSSCSGPSDGATHNILGGSLLNHVIRENKTLNAVAPSGMVGQVAANNAAFENAWPIIQLYDFSAIPTTVTVDYHKSGGDQLVTLTFDRIPSSLIPPIQLDRMVYPENSQVFALLYDPQLNVDPTEEDSWTWGANSSNPQLFYQAFDRNGVPDAETSPSSMKNLIGNLTSLMFNHNGKLTINPTANSSRVIDFESNGKQTLNPTRGNPALVTTAQTGRNMEPITFLEQAGTNMGIFGNWDSSNISNIVTVNNPNIRGQSASLSYNNQNTSITGGFSFGSLDFTINGTWNSNQPLNITLTDNDAIKNSRVASNLNLNDQNVARLASLTIGDPFTLSSGNPLSPQEIPVFITGSSVSFGSSLHTGNGTVSITSSNGGSNHAEDETFSARPVFKIQSSSLHTGSGLLVDLKTNMANLRSSIHNSNHGAITSTTFRGFNFLNYDLRSLVNGNSSSTATISKVHAYLVYNAAGITNEGGNAFSKLHVISLANSSSLQDFINLNVTSPKVLNPSGLTNTLFSPSIPNIDPIGILFTFDVTGTGYVLPSNFIGFPVVTDFFSIGILGDGPSSSVTDRVNNAIYRPELDATGINTPTFTGTMQYIMLNQLSILDPATYSSLKTIGNQLVFAATDEMDEEGNTPQLIYLDLGQDGVNSEISASRGIPTYAGVISLDKLTYSPGDTVTVAVSDNDLSVDNNLVDIYTTVPSGNDPASDTVGKSGLGLTLSGNPFGKLSDIQFNNTRWAYTGCFGSNSNTGTASGYPTSLSASGFTLVETAPGTGIFTGTFTFPDQFCKSPSSIASTSGITINATYVDFSDNFGNTHTVFDTASASGLGSSPTVSFDSTKYQINNLGYVIVSDPASKGAGSVTVKINSTSDTTGISTSLLEKPPGSGIFTKQINFTSGPTNSAVIPQALHVSQSDYVEALYPNVVAALSQIISSSSNGFGGNVPPSTDPIRFVESNMYQPLQSATIEANDHAANLAGKQSVTVTVTSTTDKNHSPPVSPITLTLLQNSANHDLYDLAPNTLTFVTSGASSAGTAPDILVTVGDTVFLTYVDASSHTDSATATIYQSATSTLPGFAPGNLPRAACASTANDGICDSWKTSSGISIPLYSAGISSVNSAAAYTISCTPGMTYTQDPLGDKVCPVLPVTSNTKEIYVQVDYMQGQQPSPTALANVVTAFLNAPVPIHLHIFLANQIPWQKYTYWAADPVTTNPTFVGLKTQFFALGLPVDNLNCSTLPSPYASCSALISDMVNAKRQFFHYAMFTHDQDYPTDYLSSGTAQTPGNDFIVSLGEFAGHVGSIDQQAGTFMHELGHNLGLAHGGNIGGGQGSPSNPINPTVSTDVQVNCKPNYPSVMNYAVQFNKSSGGFVNGRALDFSRGVYSPITETALSDTTNGITTPSGSLPARLTVVGGMKGTTLLAPLTVSLPASTRSTTSVTVDWDRPTTYLSFSTTDSGRTVSTLGPVTVGSGNIVITETVTLKAADTITLGTPTISGTGTGLTIGAITKSVAGAGSTTQTITITIPYSASAKITSVALGTITMPFTTGKGQTPVPTVTSSGAITPTGSTMAGTASDSVSTPAFSLNVRDFGIYGCADPNILGTANSANPNSSTMTGSNDWANLILNFRGFSTFDDSQRVRSLSLPPDEIPANVVTQVLQETGTPAPLPAPGSITVNATGASIGQGQVFTYKGNFVDNNSASWTATVNYGDDGGTNPLTLSGKSFNLSHLYTVTGTFNVAVSITSNTGLTGTANFAVVVVPFHVPVFKSMWGTTGPNLGQFNGPHGIGTGSGFVYVVDTSNNRIERFASNGSSSMAWGSLGSTNGKFNKPTDLAIDSLGNVYVTDSGNNRVQKFNANGTFVGAWGSSGSGLGQFNNPGGIAVGSGFLYVADTGNNRIERFTNNGTSPMAWGSFGTANGQFNHPTGLAVASNTVYVSDYFNKRIQEFTGTGTFITKWGSSGTGNGQFTSPTYVTLDKFGVVYVTDSSTSRIQEFTGTGTFLTTWGSIGNGTGQFKNPYGLAVGLGFVYVVDTGNNRIQVLH